eukprot:ctg_352.g228
MRGVHQAGRRQNVGRVPQHAILQQALVDERFGAAHQLAGGGVDQFGGGQERRGVVGGGKWHDSDGGFRTPWGIADAIAARSARGAQTAPAASTGCRRADRGVARRCGPG